MKTNLRRIAVVGAACLWMLAATAAGQTDPGFPTLRGEEAVEQLRQAGEYESLTAAVNAARKQDGQTAAPAAPDAFAQSAHLVAADGAADDSFGNSVAISGDTAVVGANFHTVGANTYQGAAYVFTRQRRRLVTAGAASRDRRRGE
jgi:hypothetical protein